MSQLVGAGFLGVQKRKIGHHFFPCPLSGFRSTPRYFRSLRPAGAVRVDFVDQRDRGPPTRESAIEGCDQRHAGLGPVAGLGKFGLLFMTRSSCSLCA